MSETAADSPAAKPSPWPVIIAGIAIAGGCLQARIGGQVTKVGEEVGLGIPVATVILGLCLLAAMIHGARHWRLPAMSRWQVAFLAAVSLGLLGMTRDDLRPALKELVQLAEIGCVAWLLGASLDAKSRAGLAQVWGWLGVALVICGLTGLVHQPPIRLSVARWSALVIIAMPFTLYALRAAPAWLRWPVLLLSAAAVGLRMEHAGLIVIWCLIVGLASVAIPRLRAPVAVAIVLVLIAAFPPPQAGWGVWGSMDPQYDASHTKRLVLETRAAITAPLELPFGAGLGAYKQGINHLRAGHPDQPSPAETNVPRDSNSQYLLLLVESGPAAAILLLLLITLPALYIMNRARVRVGWPERGVAQAVALALLATALVGAFATVLGRGSGIWVGLLLGLAASLCATPVDAPVSSDQPKSESWVRLAWRLLPTGMITSACLAIMLTYNNTRPSADDPRSPANRHLAALWHPQPAEVDQEHRTAYGLPLLDLRPDSADSALVIRVEGEAYESATGAFHRVQDNDASGHLALEIPADSGKAAGQATYTIDIPETGSYRLAARVYWEDGCSNSLAFQVREISCGVSSELFSRWHELRSPVLLNLPKGPTTITVQNLEDGVRLDYFYVQMLERSPSDGTN